MGLQSLEDRDLAVRAAEGSERAVAELLRRYERPIYSLVVRLVRDRVVAEDLAQEAFVRAFVAIDSYDPSRRFSSWIFKIAHNHAIDYLRKRRLDTVSLDGAPDATDSESLERTRIRVADGGESPEEYVENLELGGQLEAAISNLRPEYRTVVLLRHVEGYPYQEIAEVMDLPLGTVKTYLHRARAELRDALELVVQ